jgi:hypothetical protein
MVDRAKARQNGAWIRHGRTIRVKLGRTSREQRVRLSLDRDQYVFTSVVLGSAAVTRRRKRWDQLALLAWQRNAQHQLVTFAFDRHDRLVGQIRHPKEDLDLEEVELYVNVLARDCDRFEYLLTGRDRY